MGAGRLRGRWEQIASAAKNLRGRRARRPQAFDPGDFFRQQNKYVGD